MIDPLTTLALWTPGPVELIVLGLLGILIFGKRLPEVGRSVGKGIVEFKKGLSGVEDKLNDSDEQSSEPDRLSQTSTETDTQQQTTKAPPHETEPRSSSPSA